MDSRIWEMLQQAAKTVFPAYPVALAYLFGSHAAGRPTPWSDIDIAVVTERDFPPRERLHLELALEVALSRVMEGDFDVRIINEAPLSVKGTVLETGKLLYCADEVFRVRFESRTRNLYFDFLPVLRFHTRAYLARQRSILKRGNGS